MLAPPAKCDGHNRQGSERRRSETPVTAYALTDGATDFALLRASRGVVDCSPSTVYKTCVNSGRSRALFIGNAVVRTSWPLGARAPLAHWFCAVRPATRWCRSHATYFPRRAASSLCQTLWRSLSSVAMRLLSQAWR